MQVINAHLSLRSGERRAQAAALLGSELDRPPRLRRTRQSCWVISTRRLIRAPTGFIARRIGMRNFSTRSASRNRLFTPAPRFCDSITCSSHPSVEVMNAAPVRTALSRVASDHFPLLAELRVPSRARLVGKTHATDWRNRVALCDDLAVAVAIGAALRSCTSIPPHKGLSHEALSLPGRVLARTSHRCARSGLESDLREGRSAGEEDRERCRFHGNQPEGLRAGA